MVTDKCPWTKFRSALNFSENAVNTDSLINAALTSVDKLRLNTALGLASRNLLLQFVSNSSPQNRLIMRTATFFAGLILLALQACSPDHYKTMAYNDHYQSHHAVAILPFEVHFTGTRPRQMTWEEMASIEEGEGVFLQEALYNEFNKQNRRRKKNIRVKLQSPQMTLALLDKNDIHIRDAWHMPPIQLAEILGVDAVVVSEISVDQFLSDKAAFAINTANVVSTILVGSDRYTVDLPKGYMQLSCRLVEGKGGDVMWIYDTKQHMSLSESSGEIMDAMNKRISRRFPYRK